MEILQEIGSYAGIAAILGLAVLSALYFSQARDVKRLREWAGRAPERGGVPVPAQPQPPRAVTAQPVSQATRPPARPVPGGTPPPVPRPPGAVAPATGAAASAAGAAPAVARGPAPATPAAAQVDDGAQPPAADSHPDDGSRTPPSGDELDVTKMDTVVHPPPTLEDGDEDDDAADLEATAIAPPATAAAAGAGSGDDEDADGEDDAYAAGEDYEDDDGEDDGDDDGDGGLDEEPDESDDQTEVYATGEFDTGEQDEWRPEDEHSEYPFTDEHELAPLTPPAGTPRPPSPPPPYRRRGVQPATASGGDSGRILPPYEEARPGGPSEPPSTGAGSGAGRRRALAIVGAGVAVAVLVFGALQLTGGSDDPADEPAVGLSAGGADDDAGGGGGGGAAEPVDPGQVTVAVLNGTTVPGLAATIGDQVGAEGFQLGTVTNSFDQERAESVVLYAPGAEAEAAEVGRRLGISQREQIDAESQALAGDATVVVVAGADQPQQ